MARPGLEDLPTANRLSEDLESPARIVCSLTHLESMPGHGPSGSSHRRWRLSEQPTSPLQVIAM